MVHPEENVNPLYSVPMKRTLPPHTASPPAKRVRRYDVYDFLFRLVTEFLDAGSYCKWSRVTKRMVAVARAKGRCRGWVMAEYKDCILKKLHPFSNVQVSHFDRSVLLRGTWVSLQLPNLRFLDVRDVAVDDFALMCLVSNAQNLTSLALNAANITSMGLAFLRTLTQLCHLSLEGSHRRGVHEGFVYLRRLPLKFLELNDCSYITGKSFEYLGYLPLRHLDLRDSHRITDLALAHVLHLSLRYLNLENCVNITGKGLQHLEHLPLEYLNLNNARLIDDDALRHLQRLPLKLLYLRRCTRVTDAGVEHLRLLPLEVLDLSYCTAVTDTSIGLLLELPLAALGLCNTQVTDQCLPHLAPLPLTCVLLQGTRVTKEAVQRLCAQFPSLKHAMSHRGVHLDTPMDPCPRCPWSGAYPGDIREYVRAQNASP